MIGNFIKSYTPKHRRFEYHARFVDPVKDDLKARRKKIINELEERNDGDLKWVMDEKKIPTDRKELNKTFIKWLIPITFFIGMYLYFKLPIESNLKSIGTHLTSLTVLVVLVIVYRSMSRRK